MSFLSSRQLISRVCGGGGNQAHHEFIEPTFVGHAFARSTDCFKPLSVSSDCCGDRPQPLQSRPLTAKVQRLQRVVDSTGQPNTFVKPQPA